MRPPAVTRLEKFDEDTTTAAAQSPTGTDGTVQARPFATKLGGPSVDAALRSAVWLRGLPGSCLSALASHAHVITVARKRVMVDAGEHLPGLMLLLAGHAFAERLRPPGKVAMLREARPGDCLADIALLEGGPSALRWRAVKPCQVLLVPMSAFRLALQAHASLAHSFNQHFSSQMRRANRRIHMLACLPVEERVLRQLQTWAEPGAHGLGVLRNPLSQTELALAVGASREMTSRSIARLKQRGLLRYDHWSSLQVSLEDGLAGGQTAE